MLTVDIWRHCLCSLSDLLAFDLKPRADRLLTLSVRRPAAASAELLRMARRGQLTMLVSVPLFIEYEAKCTLAEHVSAAGISLEDARAFLDGLSVIVEPVAIRGRADMRRFDAIMRRKGGLPPREGDEA